MGLTMMPADDDINSRFPYGDDVDFGYRNGGPTGGGGNDGNGGGDGGDYPRTPQPGGGGPTAEVDRMLPPSTLNAFDPTGISNVVDVEARDMGVLQEIARRNGLNNQQTAALGRVMGRRS